MDDAKKKATPEQEAEIKEFLKLLGNYDKAKAEENMSATTATALLVLLVPISITCGLLVIGVDAYILMTLWKWFVADLFKTQLSYLAAFGITMIVGLFDHEKVEHKTWKDVASYFIARLFVRPILFLSLGFLALHVLA